MQEQKKSRRRKAPPNTEWHGDTLYGRIRLNGKQKRWSLRTSDVDLARQIIAADIERLKAEVWSPDCSRVRYEDMFASWAERHIGHEVAGLTVKRYAVSLKQLEPFLRGKFKDEIAKALISAIVDGRRAAGVSTATIKRDLGALASVLDYNDAEPNVARDRLKKLKERRDPIVLPEISHIERMIARAPGCLGALVHVAWLTGCRLDELVGAERAKLDHNRRQFTVRGKRNKLRVVDLDFGSAYDVIRKLPIRLGCKWLFWHGDGQPYRNLSSRFAAIVRSEHARAIEEAKKAGLDEADFLPFRFHDMRHRHAVDWLKADRSIYDLQQRLGHTSIRTTEIYLTFLTPEERRVVMFGVQQGSLKESQV
jgi:integrase/recombinase XerD